MKKVILIIALLFSTSQFVNWEPQQGTDAWWCYLRFVDNKNVHSTSGEWMLAIYDWNGFIWNEVINCHGWLES